MNVDCRDKSLLIAYLYGEADANEREAFERHLATCAACSSELRGLGEVRAGLQEWTPPEVSLGFRVVRDEARQPVVPFAPPAAGRSRWTAAVPAWARLAAAVLVLAVGAAIANLDVRVGNGGVSISTGWRQPAATRAGNGPGTEAWRAEFAALESKLRRELAPTPAASQPDAASAVPMNASAPLAGTSPAARGLSAATTAELARRFDALIAESERRQQRAFENLLATRLVQFGRDVESQRRADLVRIQQGLGQMDTRTTSELVQLREMQKYLYRVANIQEIK
ncbi:MAG: anti-sigma factor family protein [Bacteroidales bacterium]